MGYILLPSPPENIDSKKKRFNISHFLYFLNQTIHDGAAIAKGDVDINTSTMTAVVVTQFELFQGTLGNMNYIQSSLKCKKKNALSVQLVHHIGD